MNRPIRFFVVSGLVTALGIAAIYAIAATRDDDGEKTVGSMENRPVSLAASEQQAVAEFESKLKAYVELHQKAESNLEPLGESATPEEIDVHREQLRAQIKAARVSAKRGDFFTPGMEALIRRVCAAKASGDGGANVKATVMDENPGKLPNLSVNTRYPDGVPMATMPVELLETLPKLTDYMEYR
ncbi:MAG TPA: hypothetical protein VF247_04340, partial [Candidatus Krumholzibacteria bacterium]